MTNPLAHHTIWDDPSRIAVELPFCPSLQNHHELGSFHLVENPVEEKRAVIIGMFVLRPSLDSWASPILDEDGLPANMYKIKNGWAFNLDGLDGGWLLAYGSVVDAYRLGLQYGISDAVIVGSHTVSTEGCDSIPSETSLDYKKGYLWQPYGPCSWSHVAAADPDIFRKVEEQRTHWQKLGYVSERKYPAQIVVTWSGEHHDGSRDFLEAAIFKEMHPNGEPIEVYILTSDAGASRIRSRAHKFGLQDRIDCILIPLSPPDMPTEIDLKALPSLLYSRYGMKIVNHDGGQVVLRKFCAAGILSQMNLTLCRKKSLLDVVKEHSDLSDETRASALLEFNQRVRSFFTTSENDVSGDGCIPSTLKPVAVIADSTDDVAVVTFDCRGVLDF